MKIKRVVSLLCLLMLTSGVRAEQKLVQDPNFPLIQLPMEYDSHRTTKRFDPKPGKGVAIFDQKGPGCVRHFWITSTAPERLQIEITYGGADKPQIKMKMNHFFGVLLNQKPYRIESAPIKLLPRSGFNSYFPIPYQESCKIVLRNVSKKKVGVWSMVNYQKYAAETEVTPLRLNATYTHAPKAEPLGTILMADIEGSGFVAGMMHAIKRFDHKDMIWHTGGDTWLIDGETNPHVLRGIGSEDVFCYSFGVYKDLSQWVGGVHAVGENKDCSEIVAYRFFGPDAVTFKSSMILRMGTRENMIENMVYYYKDMSTKVPEVESPKEWTIRGTDKAWFFDKFKNGALDKKFQGAGRAVSKEVQVKSEHTWVDFSRWLRYTGTGNIGTQPHHCAADASTVITSEKARKAKLVLGFDDWVKVWLNGEVVALLQHDKGMKTAEIPVELKKGDNKLTIRLSNADNEEWRCWAFSCVIK